MKPRLTDTIENPLNNGVVKEMPTRDAKGRIVPGMVLNPAGKPKGSKHFATLLMEQLKIMAKDKNGQPVLIDGKKANLGELMTQAMIRQAVRGNVHAFDSVADRIDGKPKQDMEIEVTAMPTPIYQGKSINKKKTGK